MNENEWNEIMLAVQIAGDPAGPVSTRKALLMIVHALSDQDKRIRSLEAKARDYQEDGALAVRDVEWWQSIPHDLRFSAWQEQGRRAEAAERERDEARGEVGGWSQVATDAITERNVFRDLLEQYAAVDEGLGLHLPNCRKNIYERGSSPCTCGLTAALASATPAPEDTPTPAHLDGLERAWILIANAGGGNWETQTTEWQESAARWRDEVWHAALGTPGRGW